MQQADKAVAERNVLHRLHGQLVMVGRNVCSGEDRRQLVLCRGDLVVLCLSKHAELPQLFVELLHERGNSRLDRAEVMVFKLLTLRCACTEQRAARVNEVRALIVELFIDKEIFLLGPTVVMTRFVVESPKRRRIRTACALNASMERSSGVFLSSTSPP